MKLGPKISFHKSNVLPDSRTVRLLSTEAPLDYEVSVDVHGQRDVDDPRGEMIIAAPEPTGALIDIIAVEFEPANSDRTAP